MKRVLDKVMYPTLRSKVTTKFKVIQGQMSFQGQSLVQGQRSLHGKSHSKVKGQVRSCDVDTGYESPVCVWPRARAVQYAVHPS